MLEVGIVWWIKYRDCGVLGIVGKWMLEVCIFWRVNYWDCRILDIGGKWMLEMWVVRVGIEGC